MTRPTGSSGLRTIVVDWPTLRLSLARERRRAGPTWVLRALVEEACRVVDDGGRPPGTVVWLFLTPVSEYRADRELLASAAVPDPAVDVRVRCLDGDLVGVELALRAADAWHDHPDGTLAMVTDTGRFATVVRHFARRSGGRPPWLLHLHERPPPERGLGAETGAAGRPRVRRLRLELDGPPPPRHRNAWDSPAEALHRLAGRTDLKPARWSLQAASSRRRADRSPGPLLYAGISLEELEPVDNLVADLWRLDWGGPVEATRVRAEALRRVGGGDADALLEALLAAQLLRWHDRERLEVPHPWREGLLLPMRRVVLRLAARPDLSAPLERLVHQHRRRCIGRPGGLGPPGGHLRRVEHESRVESWRWVRSALVEQLQTVVERPDWTARRAVWTLTGSKFASDTVATAEQIRRRLARPVATGQLEAALRQEGIARPGRWLRVLRDVGLVRRQGDRWLSSPEAGELHLP